MSSVVHTLSRLNSNLSSPSESVHKFFCLLIYYCNFSRFRTVNCVSIDFLLFLRLFFAPLFVSTKLFFCSIVFWLSLSLSLSFLLFFFSRSSYSHVPLPLFFTFQFKINFFFLVKFQFLTLFLCQFWTEDEHSAKDTRSTTHRHTRTSSSSCSLFSRTGHKRMNSLFIRLTCSQLSTFIMRRTLAEIVWTTCN
jgi:hypothetical protein